MEENVILADNIVDTSQFQKVLQTWVDKNFGNRPAWQPLLGIQEEVGELSHAFLKREQGIRNTEPHNENIEDAVADIFIYLCDFCNAEGLDLGKCINNAWEHVSQRDWASERKRNKEQE